MRKKIIISILLGTLFLSACGAETIESVATQGMDATTEEAIAITQEALNEQKEALEYTVTVPEGADAPAYSGPNVGDEGMVIEQEFVTIQMDNPSWEYFYIGSENEAITMPFKLNQVEKSTNEIIDRDKWLAENGFEPISEVSDGNYTCSIGGDGQWVNIMYDGEAIAELDFSQLQYSSDCKIEDWDFVRQEIHHVEVEGNVLYVSMFHYTYAESGPSNAYIMAISLEDYDIIWKTQPLVCNSLNFQIVEDIIFCGYGFTAEPDYLYQLDKNTGAVLAQEPLKSMAEYIFYEDGKLYVRTYDTDYVFAVEQQ